VGLVLIATTCGYSEEQKEEFFHSVLKIVGG